MEEFYDKKGYRIYPGDVLKVYHFTSALRRERRYMYKLVIEKAAMLWGVAITELNKKELREAHRYRLKWSSQNDFLMDTEIVDGYGPGDLLCFKDRPKQKLDSPDREPVAAVKEGEAQGE